MQTRTGPAPRRRGRATAVGLAAWALVASGCVPRPQAEPPLPPPPAVVEVTLADYRFELAGEVPPGRVVFNAYNRGTVDHSLTLIVLPEDFPPLDEQLRGDTRRPVTNLALLPRRPPGERGTFAVDLVPGRYGLVCFVPGPDGVAHGVRGMNAEFRVV